MRLGPIVSDQSRSSNGGIESKRQCLAADGARLAHACLCLKYRSSQRRAQTISPSSSMVTRNAPRQAVSRSSFPKAGQRRGARPPGWLCGSLTYTSNAGRDRVIHNQNRSRSFLRTPLRRRQWPVAQRAATFAAHFVSREGTCSKYCPSSAWLWPSRYCCIF